MKNTKTRRLEASKRCNQEKLSLELMMKKVFLLLFHFFSLFSFSCDIFPSIFIIFSLPSCLLLPFAFYLSFFHVNKLYEKWWHETSETQTNCRSTLSSSLSAQSISRRHKTPKKPRVESAESRWKFQIFSFYFSLKGLPGAGSHYHCVNIHSYAGGRERKWNTWIENKC